MTYFGAKLREVLNRPEHIAVISTPSRKLASLSRDHNHALNIRYKDFDAFLDSVASKRRIR